MGSEALVYPFLFIALYFEAFLLITFLSKPAQERRRRARGDRANHHPTGAIIVSVWNEETTIAGTIESLLRLEYPKDKLSLIVVNDGSTDGTGAEMDRLAAKQHITAIHKEHAGKYAAMNAGIAAAADAELIGFLDADSFVAPDALREIVAAFADSQADAVTASMSIHDPQTLLQRMQYAEYSISIILRHAFASINSLYVTPGPFSFYRRTVFQKLGAFKHAYLAEDMEMAMRMQRAGMRIGNAIRARVYTKGPPTLARLLKQRIRWTTGFLRNVLFDYRDLVWNRKNPTLGFFVLPLGVFAIGSGIFLFLLSIIRLTQEGYQFLTVVQAAPISYAFTLHPMSWFYLPITITLLLGVILLAIVMTWMVVGKHLSRTPGTLAVNAIVYLILYGVVTPLWLIRSVTDVAFDVSTSWR